MTNKIKHIVNKDFSKKTPIYKDFLKALNKEDFCDSNQLMRVYKNKSKKAINKTCEYYKDMNKANSPIKRKVVSELLSGVFEKALSKNCVIATDNSSDTDREFIKEVKVTGSEVMSGSNETNGRYNTPHLFTYYSLENMLETKTIKLLNIYVKKPNNTYHTHGQQGVRHGGTWNKIDMVIGLYSNDMLVLQGKLEIECTTEHEKVLNNLKKAYSNVGHVSMAQKAQAKKSLKGMKVKIIYE